MVRLSFIVPFYNVEPYIEECIRSLYNQDIPQEDYEVICIDDCSPDGSRSIVEHLQNEYPTLKLLSTPENLRQGGARNMGLDAAQGKYVWFVDSDDYIKPNCIRTMLECAEKNNVDLLPFYFTFSNQNSAIFEDKQLYTYGVCTGSQYIFESNTSIPQKARCSCVWTQIISKELISKHNLRFVIHKQYEDDDFAIQLYAFAKRVFLLNIFPYIARSNTSSTTKQQISYHTILDIKCQAERLINLEPTLSIHDKRWNSMIKDLVNWSIKERVLASLYSLPKKEQLRFFLHHEGWINNIKCYVGWHTFIALHSYIYWQFCHHTAK